MFISINFLIIYLNQSQKEIALESMLISVMELSVLAKKKAEKENKQHRFRTETD